MDIQPNDFRPETREAWNVQLGHLYNDMASLFQKESLLLRTELTEKITEAKVAMTSLVIGLSFMTMGGFALVATAIIALNYVMPLWGAALLVTAVLLIVGGFMVMAAKKKLEMDKLTPRHSIDTFGEITSTFKERINEFKPNSHH
jgi:hypothetical protein